MIDYIHAQLNDRKQIQAFLRNYWSSDHILVTDDEVFDHFYINDQQLQFFLAKDVKGNIVGVLGYTTNSQFDNDLKEDTAWLSMWMSMPSLKEPVGIKLIQVLEDSLNVDYVASLGVGNKVIPIYQRLEYKTGSMFHLMRPAPNKFNDLNTDYKITNIKHKVGTIFYENKSDLFLESKYLNNNFYNYHTFYIYHDSFHISTIVGRVLFCPDSKKNIFRIVDFSGEKKGISIFAKNATFKNLSIKIDYIDILLSEVDFIEDSIFEFCSSDNYLPLYFEPFVADYKQKNFCYKKMNNENTNELLIITGDCDQERPNIRKINLN